LSERFEFCSASGAFAVVWGDDGDEEGCLIDAGEKSLLPVCSPGEVDDVLVDSEGGSALCAKFVFESFSQCGKCAACVLVIEAGVAPERFRLSVGQGD
jgi:hypothetical protein